MEVTKDGHMVAFPVDNLVKPHSWRADYGVSGASPHLNANYHQPA